MLAVLERVVLNSAKVAIPLPMKNPTKSERNPNEPRIEKAGPALRIYPFCDFT